MGPFLNFFLDAFMTVSDPCMVTEVWDFPTTTAKGPG